MLYIFATYVTPLDEARRLATGNITDNKKYIVSLSKPDERLKHSVIITVNHNYLFMHDTIKEKAFIIPMTRVETITAKSVKDEWFIKEMVDKTIDFWRIKIPELANYIKKIIATIFKP